MSELSVNARYCRTDEGSFKSVCDALGGWKEGECKRKKREEELGGSSEKRYVDHQRAEASERARAESDGIDLLARSGHLLHRGPRPLRLLPFAAVVVVANSVLSV